MGGVTDALMDKLPLCELHEIVPLVRCLKAFFLSSEATNKFLDQILVNARPEIQKIDPLRLPDERHGFSKKIIFVTGNRA